MSVTIVVYLDAELQGVHVVLGMGRGVLPPPYGCPVLLTWDRPQDGAGGGEGERGERS